MALWSWLFGERKSPRGVVLALGGGGARGLAHLGVLSVLEEAGVPVLGIAGTSAGAVMGAMWLAHGSAAAARQRWRELLNSGLLPPLGDVRLAADVSSRDNLLLQFARRLRDGATVALALERRSLIDPEGFANALAFVLDDLPFSALPLPFATVTTDFSTGAPFALSAGNLRQAVAASCAIPGVLPPCRVDGRWLIDGGVTCDVPVGQARCLAAGSVLAVVTSDAPGEVDPERVTVPRALMRAGLMTHQSLVEHILADADLVLRPRVDGIHWSDFGRSDEAFEAGRTEACAHLKRILRTARVVDRRRRAGPSAP